MDGGDGGIGGGYSSDPLLSLPVVEISGPKNFVALGGNNLTIRYRLSPLAYNLSTPFASLLSPTIQLFWLPEEGPAKFVASQDPPSSVISLAWQEVLTLSIQYTVESDSENLFLLSPPFPSSYTWRSSIDMCFLLEATCVCTCTSNSVHNLPPYLLSSYLFSKE